MRWLSMFLEAVPCSVLGHHITYLAQGRFVFLIYGRWTHVANVPQGGPISFYVLRGGSFVFLVLCEMDLCATFVVPQNIASPLRHCPLSFSRSWFLPHFAPLILFSWPNLLPSFVGSRKSFFVPRDGKLFLIGPLGMLDLLCFPAVSMSSYHRIAHEIWWIGSKSVSLL